MSDGFFTWAVVASIGTHLVGLAAATALVAAHGGAETPPAPIPIEVVRVGRRLASPVTAASCPHVPGWSYRKKHNKEVVDSRLVPAPPSCSTAPRSPNPWRRRPGRRAHLLAGNFMHGG
jgi:hypothetical protein